MKDEIAIGISSCLLGNRVRYDGNHKHDHYITDTLGQFFTYVPTCPEVECGLPVPREAMRLVETESGVSLRTITSNVDHTERMVRWAADKVESLAKANLSGFIFKARSPSSGMADAKVYSEKGVIRRKGPGLFAQLFMARFPMIPVIDDGRLHDPVLRENFIERVFVFTGWQKLRQSRPRTNQLVSFHASHKLLVMSHRHAAVAQLGRIVAACKGTVTADQLDAYESLLMKAVALPATIKNHTNTLQHMAGYFKKQLSADEKQELQQVIETYHQGLVPLIVPLTLIKHFTRLFGEPYLSTQVYLNPHPLELMLRNHV